MPSRATPAPVGGPDWAPHISRRVTRSSPPLARLRPPPPWRSFAAARPSTGTEAVTPSSGPRELWGGQRGLAFILDAERTDACPLRLGCAEFRPGGMEHPDDPGGLACLDAERH